MPRLEITSTSFRAVPPVSIDDFRLLGGRVAVYVTASACPNCSRFRGERHEYESTHLNRHSVVTLLADEAHERDIAFRCGVTSLPAYILLEDGKTEVSTPPLSVELF
jgi:hypothetical protein